MKNKIDPNQVGRELFHKFVDLMPEPFTADEGLTSILAATGNIIGSICVTFHMDISDVTMDFCEALIDLTQRIESKNNESTESDT